VVADYVDSFGYLMRVGKPVIAAFTGLCRVVMIEVASTNDPSRESHATGCVE
jgi:enoyl-CoA hydratase/carnithine racemase